MTDGGYTDLYHIVGCNHGIQIGAGGFADLDGADANEQRGHFRALIEDIFREGAIQIFLEEDGTLEETAAQQIARKRDVSWENINTSNEDKDQMGIPRDYLSGANRDDQKREWNCQRDVFMVGKIAKHRGKFENAIVICGFDHFEPIAALLEAQGIPVRRWDYRASGWFKPGVFADA
jgi:hypothetical protein